MRKATPRNLFSEPKSENVDSLILIKNGSNDFIRRFDIDISGESSISDRLRSRQQQRTHRQELSTSYPEIFKSPTSLKEEGKQSPNLDFVRSPTYPLHLVPSHFHCSMFEI